MYVNTVRRAFYKHLDTLTKKKVPLDVIAQEEQDFLLEMQRLENLCGKESVPDIWLYLNWKTPVELKMFDITALAFGVEYERMLGNKKVFQPEVIPEYALRAQLNRIDQILIRVMAFT